MIRIYGTTVTQSDTVIIMKEKTLCSLIPVQETQSSIKKQHKLSNISWYSKSMAWVSSEQGWTSSVGVKLIFEIANSQIIPAWHIGKHGCAKLTFNFEKNCIDIASEIPQSFSLVLYHGGVREWVGWRVYPRASNTHVQTHTFTGVYYILFA